MLQSSSSEEELDEKVAVAAPVALASAPLRPRPVVVEDESHPAGAQHSPASNIDQRSLSTVSRGSGGSGDNVSLSGTELVLKQNVLF